MYILSFRIVLYGLFFWISRPAIAFYFLLFMAVHLNQCMRYLILMDSMIHNDFLVYRSAVGLNSLLGFYYFVCQYPISKASRQIRPPA